MMSRWLFLAFVLLALAQFVVPQKGGGGGSRPGGGGQSRPQPPRQPQQPKRPDPPRQPQQPKRPDPPRQTQQPKRPDPPRQTQQPKRPDPPRQTQQPNRPDPPRQPQQPNRPEPPRQTNRPDPPRQPNRPEPPRPTNRPDPPRPNNPGGGWGNNGGRPGGDRGNRPDWRPYGNPWDRPGNDHNRPWGDRPRGGNDWQRTTIVGIIPAYPVWAGPNWNDYRPPRTVYTTWDPYYYGGAPAPWFDFPRLELPPITINLPQPPQFGCSAIETTYPTIIETTQTYTDTITQPPQDNLVTVYIDEGSGDTSTDWGPVETIYEVFVYTTTATVDVIQTTTDCGLW